MGYRKVVKKTSMLIKAKKIIYSFILLSVYYILIKF